MPLRDALQKLADETADSLGMPRPTVKLGAYRHPVMDRPSVSWAWVPGEAVEKGRAEIGAILGAPAPVGPREHALVTIGGQPLCPPAPVIAAGVPSVQLVAVLDEENYQDRLRFRDGLKRQDLALLVARVVADALFGWLP